MSKRERLSKNWVSCHSWKWFICYKNFSWRITPVSVIDWKLEYHNYWISIFRNICHSLHIDPKGTSGFAQYHCWVSLCYKKEIVVAQVAARPYMTYSFISQGGKICRSGFHTRPRVEYEALLSCRSLRDHKWPTVLSPKEERFVGRVSMPDPGRII